MDNNRNKFSAIYISKISKIQKILICSSLASSLLMSGSIAYAWDTGSKKAKNSNVQVSQQSNSSGNTMQVVVGIKVRYGNHTYSSRSQQEYDQVMKIVDNAVKDIGNVRLDGGSRYEKYFEMYLDGAKPSDYTHGSLENRGLTIAEGRLGVLVKAVVKKDTIIKAYKASLIGGQLLRQAKVLTDGTPRSAYDALVRGVTDCDPDAQVYSAVLDSLGFNTAILAGVAHADVFVEIDGEWYLPAGGGFRITDMSRVVPGVKVIASPTFGGTMK